MLFLLASRQDTIEERGKGDTKGVFFITGRDTIWNFVLCEKYIGIAILIGTPKNKIKHPTNHERI